MHITLSTRGNRLPLLVQDANNFRSKMNSVAYGTVMAKAAEDYKQVGCMSAHVPAGQQAHLLQHFVYTPVMPTAPDACLESRQASKRLHRLSEASPDSAAQELLARRGPHGSTALQGLDP